MSGRCAEKHGGHIGRLKVHLWNFFALFLFVCAQTLQDGRTLYSKKPYVFFYFNGFWRENDVTRLTAKFQDMAKQKKK